MTLRAATSCSVHPAGRFGSTDAEGSIDGWADGSADGVAAAGVGAVPKLHCGAAAAWHAATLAATPASPVTPAARRKPRRVRPVVAGAGGPLAATDGAGSEGWVGMGSTDMESPVRGTAGHAHGRGRRGGARSDERPHCGGSDGGRGARGRLLTSCPWA